MKLVSVLTKPNLRWALKTLAVFLVSLPLLTIALWCVQSGNILSVVGYPLVFPGWFLALWVFGYSSHNVASQSLFIVVINALLYSVAIGRVFFKPTSADR